MRGVVRRLAPVRLHGGARLWLQRLGDFIFAHGELFGLGGPRTRRIVGLDGILVFYVVVVGEELMRVRVLLQGLRP